MPMAAFIYTVTFILDAWPGAVFGAIAGVIAVNLFDWDWSVCWIITAVCAVIAGVFGALEKDPHHNR